MCKRKPCKPKIKGYRPGIITWHDAAFHGNVDCLVPVRDGLSQQRSMGWIKQKKGGYVVAHTIQENQPFDFHDIPFSREIKVSRNFKPFEGLEPGIIFWLDATFSFHSDQEGDMPEEKMFSPSYSMGWIKREREGYHIIHTVCDNKPNQFLSIPDGWVKRVFYFNGKRKRGPK